MARLEADLSTFILASDYDSAHYNWSEKELSTLGSCKATAEVIKRRLEDNGLKVKEMYAIEHKGEKKTDSQAKEHHRAIDETKIHYHIVVKFEPNHGATLKEIAKCIGVPPEVIEKPKSGGHSYDNMLSYLTHIKYENKIQYAPEDVVTLAGTDYMDYYNERKERWIKARVIMEKKGGKARDRLFREAMIKLENGELAYEELAYTKEYCGLLTDLKYQKRLFKKSNLVIELTEIYFRNMKKRIENGEIASWEKIEADEHFKLMWKYHGNELEEAFKNTFQGELKALKESIKYGTINLFYEEIEALSEYKTLCFYFREEIESEIRTRARKEYEDLKSAIQSSEHDCEITSIDEVRTKDEYKLAYRFFKDWIEYILRDTAEREYNSLDWWIKNHKITSMDDVKASKIHRLAYRYCKEDIEKKLLQQN